MAAACGGGGGLDPLPSGQPMAGSGNTIGTGSVRVGLILPLSAPGGVGMAAASIRNAADLAMSEFDNPDITVLVKDDAGEANMARDMVQQAIAEGAELILGPFTAPSVVAAAPVAKAAGRPMIAFSSDVSVAQPGVFLLSFTPQSDVTRVVGFAASRGKKSVAALLPEGAFGNVVAAELQQQIASQRLTEGPIQRYAPGRAGEAAKALAGQISGVDCLLSTDLTAEMMRTADAIAAAGIRNVQMLGTGVWNDASVLQKPALQGGWFAAPDAAGYNSFAERYRTRFNSSPTRTATIGYDAVALAAALVKTQGANRFSAQTLTNSSGFAGQDGVFRFRPDGTNERALAVLQVNNRTAQVISPAPRSFG
ncbi:MAG: penicillin-binding protein activator [Methylocystis sp.]|nr:penicillin-binding protein activator [Methylocystis sp.]MCA3584908.1 penicillin-binding protein activator [Methylocystis sp.]MCA3589697.1 penicillin-binding protein activator [Methylocystis sp.]MCA3591126.1 penicillin-binding protein activator [Methylocystis sp.]